MLAMPMQVLQRIVTNLLVKHNPEFEYSSNQYTDLAMKLSPIAFD